MRRADPEVEAVVPRISPTHFTKDNSARELNIPFSQLGYMEELAGDWKVVGWALADDVAPRDLCLYVVLLEKHGQRLWKHGSNYTIETIADIIGRDNTKIVPL